MENITEKPLSSDGDIVKNADLSAGNVLPTDVTKLPQLTLTTYLKLVEPLAAEIEKSTGIIRWVPMVQSAHESANGNSGLARNHCNLFGIVATDSWKKKGGAIANLPTWEEIKGQRVDMNREFRAYPTWRDSFLDWSHLITTLSVYKKAWDLMKHKESVADGIKSMALVYASDSHYSRKLLDIYSSISHDK